MEAVKELDFILRIYQYRKADDSTLEVFKDADGMVSIRGIRDGGVDEYTLLLTYDQATALTRMIHMALEYVPGDGGGGL